MTQEAGSIDMHEKVRVALKAINEEFEEHLQAINENTQEIQEHYSYVCEIENKIAKLGERIDEIYSILGSLAGKKFVKPCEFEDIDPLTTTEKTVFLNLYTEEDPITYVDLARKMNMPIAVARQHVVCLIEKGVPVHRVYKNTRPHLVLDQRFKNLQAKKNILKIEQKILV